MERIVSIPDELRQNPLLFQRNFDGFGYVPGAEFKSLETQANEFSAMMPELVYDPLALAPYKKPAFVMPGAEAFCLMAKVSALGKRYGIQDPYTAGYPHITAHYIHEFRESISLQIGGNKNPTYEETFQQLCAGENGPRQVYPHLVPLIERLEEEALGDYLAMPVNLGVLFQSWNSRAVATVAPQLGMLPLCAAHFFSLMLTHSHFVAPIPPDSPYIETLRLGCPGDFWAGEHPKGIDGEQHMSIRFRRGSRTNLSTHVDTERCYGYESWAVGFLPL
ncbi:MAG TPA: hypothetical protein VLA04_02570 [Verrucomicrobiae bacterium]|nr:hypothetical protein [Verrucomicrobiae bacterium]